MTAPAGSDWPRPPSKAVRRLAVLGVWGLLSVCLPAGRPGRGAGSPPPAAEVDLAAQRGICFPATRAADAVKTYTGSGVVVWTDAPLDGPALIDHLERVQTHLRAMLPAPRPTSPARPAAEPATRPVALAVYARRSDYLALWRRVGSRYGGRFGEITTDGYSYRVFCAASYGSPRRFRQCRSVLCHEYAHVWLYQRRGLRNDGNWLTEGLATAVQLHFFPDAGSRADFARWLDTGRMLPLKRLMDLERIAPKDYWQAATLIELLARRYPQKLPAVVSAFNEGRSAYAIVTGVLGTDFLTLRRQWAEHVRQAARQRPASTATAPQPGP